MRIATTAAVLALVATSAFAGGKKGEWAKGVPFTTKWEEAIKLCKETGRILFIYNGWERRNI